MSGRKEFCELAKTKVETYWAYIAFCRDSKKNDMFNFHTLLLKFIDYMWSLLVVSFFSTVIKVIKSVKLAYMISKRNAAAAKLERLQIELAVLKETQAVNDEISAHKSTRKTSNSSNSSIVDMPNPGPP
ncbi:hypothetical protein O0L34_g169 [Tuta absoluta]|nr:hypothetical protein O0L34_g169 [Tuta absoluta]